MKHDIFSFLSYNLTDTKRFDNIKQQTRGEALLRKLPGGGKCIRLGGFCQAFLKGSDVALEAERGRKGRGMKIGDQIMFVLDRAEVCGNVVRLNSGQLDRKLYQAVDKVLVTLGGKWNRKEKGHVFAEDPTGIFDELLLTGEYSDKKKDFGAFFTPAWLADDVVKKSNIPPEGCIICEPSAGTGAIANAVLKLHPGRKNDIYLNDIRPDFCRTLSDQGYANITNKDFLTMESPLDKHFDRIVMNPPFNHQADIKHVTHAYNLLAPRGRLVSIMSAGVKFRDNKMTRDFRKLVDDCGKITDNPDQAFKESGTLIKTVTVVLDKAA